MVRSFSASSRSSNGASLGRLRNVQPVRGIDAELRRINQLTIVGCDTRLSTVPGVQLFVLGVGDLDRIVVKDEQRIRLCVRVDDKLCPTRAEKERFTSMSTGRT